MTTDPTHSHIDVKALAEEIAPKLVAALTADRDRIVAEAGDLLERAAMRAAFPMLVREIPALTEVMLAMVVDRFGSMTVEDLTAMLLNSQRGS